LLESLEKHFTGRAVWTPADGGLFTFMTLVDSTDTATLVERAVAAGVAFIPGAPFFVDGSGKNTMRLTFAKETDDRIRDGIARLAGVVLDKS
jgi:DNA-binding transcriptional MocR family regulator